jgi:hypothetical protein
MASGYTPHAWLPAKYSYTSSKNAANVGAATTLGPKTKEDKFSNVHHLTTSLIVNY